MQTRGPGLSHRPGGAVARGGGMASDCGGQRSLHFSPSGHSVVWGGRRSPSGFGDAHGEDCLFADALRRCGARPVLRDMRAAPAGRRRGLEAHPPQLALHRRFGGVRRASFFRACAVQSHGCLFRADRACCCSDGGHQEHPALHCLTLSFRFAEERPGRITQQALLCRRAHPPARV